MRCRLSQQNGDVGDEFLRILEPLAAIIPYMVLVGNHEEKLFVCSKKIRPGNCESICFFVATFHTTKVGLPHPAQKMECSTGLFGTSNYFVKNLTKGFVGLYSFDLGPIHFTVISTEFYFFPQYGTAQMTNQYNWFVDDLQVNRNRIFM